MSSNFHTQAIDYLTSSKIPNFIKKRYPLTNCRVTRHLPTTTSHEHGSPAETKPDRTIYAHGIKVANILLDTKLYSKVLGIWHQSLLNIQFNI